MQNSACGTDRWTKPTDVGREFASRLLVFTPTIVIQCHSQPES